MCSMFEKQACEWKDAKYDVDTTVVNEDESRFIRLTVQLLQPVIKVVI